MMRKIKLLKRNADAIFFIVSMGITLAIGGCAVLLLMGTPFVTSDGEKVLSFDWQSALSSLINSLVPLAALALVFYVAKRGLDALNLWIKLNASAAPPPIVRPPEFSQSDEVDLEWPKYPARRRNVRMN